MRMLIIGATGDIGGAVVAAALEEGHEVAVVVRSSEKLGSRRDRVRVVEGDLAEPLTLEEVVGLSDRPGPASSCESSRAIQRSR